jgi:hypothetical protein
VGSPVEADRILHRHPELGGGMARPGVLVGRVHQDVGVHPDPHRSRTPLPLRHPLQGVQLPLALHVEGQDPGPEGALHLLHRLPHPGEDDPLRRDPRLEGPVELAQGDDVGASAQGADPVQHRQVPVGLHRVGQEEVQFAEGRLEGLDPLPDPVAVVDVQGRAEALRQFLQVVATTVENPVAAGKARGSTLVVSGGGGLDPQGGRSGPFGAQYALAHITSIRLSPPPMHRSGASGVRKSGRGMQRRVAFVSS